MAVTGSTQNITTTAAQLGTGTGQRIGLVIRNPSTSGATIYVGGAAVSSANAAFAVAAGDPSLIITNGNKDSLAGESWYALTSSGTATAVAVSEIES